MRLIHCADLHLDSKMTSFLDAEHAKERRGELLHTYERMIAYAVRHQVDGILIAGDLFDTKNISRTAREVVLGSIRENPGITFYYLKGNHDSDNFLAGVRELPENLKLFGPSWSGYRVGRVVICGRELPAAEPRRSSSAISGRDSTVTINIGSNSAAGMRDDDSSALNSGDSLLLDPQDFNIVLLHGQQAESAAKDRAAVIDLRSLRGKSIDYLALGHIHSYQLEALDARGIWCYPGCLEGRGYDECGEHGFVLLDIDEERLRMRYTFVPFAGRRLYEIPVDVSGCLTMREIARAADEAIAESGCEARDLVKLVLTGDVDVETERNTEYLLTGLRNRFYDVKIKDSTRLRIDVSSYALDPTLKGEFVRTVIADAEDGDDWMTAIRYGLQALAGEPFAEI